MRKRLIAFATVVGAVLLAAGPAGAAAAGDEAREIVSRALDHNVFDFPKAESQVTMILRNKEGQERNRTVLVKSRRGDDGLRRTLVRFTAPGDVAGTGFLSLENADRDDDQYLYLPAVGQVKRVAASQKSQSFMGTEYSYGDIASVDLDRAVYTRLPDEKLGPVECRVVDAVPTGSNEQYSRRRLWINATNHVPMRIVFYDRQGVEFKVLLTEQFRQHESTWVVVRSTMRNLKNGKSTTLIVDRLDTGVTLGPEEFTTNRLEKY